MLLQSGVENGCQKNYERYKLKIEKDQIYDPRIPETIWESAEKDFRNLLMEKLPDSLSEKQKEYKIGNLLASLKRQGKIKPDSTNQQISFWILA